MNKIFTLVLCCLLFVPLAYSADRTVDSYECTIGLRKDAINTPAEMLKAISDIYYGYTDSEGNFAAPKYDSFTYHEHKVQDVDVYGVAFIKLEYTDEKYATKIQEKWEKDKRYLLIECTQ